MIQIEKCGCAEGRFPIDDRYICNTIKKPDAGHCLDDLIAKFDAEGLGCDPNCPVPCSEVVYKTTMSLAEWPSEGYQETLFKRVLKRQNPAYEQQKANGSESLQ
ncbi:amiloride-sensitive sodium channel subunit alpha-like [Orbicella faveolata]|uniref:amiloride-sensitive sodium channel subunit alpha-like n=1 Tax=Orbicella faveolata TaxID=48498 RepID=UPI0009E49D6D|nr:amiloride-sensitive sodium channel subunit alpha-like [Orbicella faveolata]